jgi:cytoskeletal protein RodZ
VSFATTIRISNHDMTTRDEARRRADVGRGGARGRTQPAAESQPTLPERLLAAREAKGVDLYRAERDTKIRARYLGALERGDYRELPGSVYTKGFLRNYALYLGLDPDEILLQWRRERGDGGAQSEPSISVPRPISAPRQGFTFSFGLVVAAALTVAVILFVGYLGFQLFRFSRPPEVAVTDPSTAVSTVDETATAYTLRGTSLPGALVSIAVAGRDQPVRATATASGTWSADVELRRGRNQFSVSATDPDTGKSVEKPVEVFITVPFPEVLAPTLTVDQPAEGATFENGAIPVQGTTANAKTVTVSAAFGGPATAGSGTKPAATPEPPAPQTADIGDDGTFNIPVELTAGNWILTIAAASPEGKTTSLTRNVSVRYKGVNLVVSIKGGPAWMKVWVDGQLDPRVGMGKLFKDGKTITFRGDQSVEVFTGSSGVTYFTLNGTTIGRLGKPGNPETWLFNPPDKPVQTNHR